MPFLKGCITLSILMQPFCFPPSVPLFNKTHSF